MGKDVTGRGRGHTGSGMPRGQAEPEGPLPTLTTASTPSPKLMRHVAPPAAELVAERLERVQRQRDAALIVERAALHGLAEPAPKRSSAGRPSRAELAQSLATIARSAQGTELHAGIGRAADVPFERAASLQDATGQTMALLNALAELEHLVGTTQKAAPPTLRRAFAAVSVQRVLGLVDAAAQRIKGGKGPAVPAANEAELARDVELLGGKLKVGAKKLEQEERAVCQRLIELAEQLGGSSRPPQPASLRAFSAYVCLIIEGNKVPADLINMLAASLPLRTLIAAGSTDAAGAGFNSWAAKQTTPDAMLTGGLTAEATLMVRAIKPSNSVVKFAAAPGWTLDEYKMGDATRAFVASSRTSSARVVTYFDVSHINARSGQMTAAYVTLSLEALKRGGFKP